MGWVSYSDDIDDRRAGADLDTDLMNENLRLRQEVAQLRVRHRAYEVELDALRSRIGPRLLVTGATDWHDGDAVREMLRFAFARYGLPGDTTLYTFGSDGAEAIANRAWRLWPQPLPAAVRLVPDWDAHGFAAKVECFDRAVAEHGITAVLAFVTKSRDAGARKVMARAKHVGIPVWRWSVSLARPVPGGVHVHTPEWRERLMRDETRAVSGPRRRAPGARTGG